MLSTTSTKRVDGIINALDKILYRRMIRNFNYLKKNAENNLLALKVINNRIKRFQLGNAFKNILFFSLMQKNLSFKTMNQDLIFQDPMQKLNQIFPL
jgi:hypothetical protein